MKVLTKVAETLIAVRPVEEVLHQVMDIVFDHIPADRGFLMLHEEGPEKKLIPMVIKHRKPESADSAKIAISKTIADRVVKDRVSILTSDAMVDPRFSAGDSIRFQGIRSAMCAPVWNKEQVIGIIFVDSMMLTNCFTLNDLDLLTALANYAAVAVERARLNQKIVAEEKKRERLGRFLSPQVTARILATSESQSAALGVPEEKELSVLFADIVGFTSMSEKMSPAAVALLLNDYLSRMTDIIFKYDGTLDKYIGDAIMAVFGAPLEMADHAARAIKSGLEMQARLAEFNSERKEGPHLRIRIGINSGRAVAGEIGSINKKEYTVLGDVVNTASRLESSVAKPGMVVIGENTYEMVKGQFNVNPLPKATLKGKEKEVGGLRGAERRRRRRGNPGPAGSLKAKMPSRARLRRRGSILFSLLLLLFVVGVVPLLWTSFTLVSRSREILELDQKALQLDKARSLSQQVAVYVESLRSHLTAVARTLEVEATQSSFSDRVTRISDAKALERYVGGDSRFYYFSIVDATGTGGALRRPAPRARHRADARRKASCAGSKASR